MRKFSFISKIGLDSRLKRIDNYKVENDGIWIPKDFILKKFETESRLEDSAISENDKISTTHHSARRHIYDDMLFIIDYFSDKEFKEHIDKLVSESENRVQQSRKETIIDALYDKIMADGTRTTRANELYEQTDERLENKIYVVKLPVNFTAVKGTTVKMLSVSSDKEDFTDSDAHNVRIGFENPNKIWANVFATECEEDVLEDIATNLKIKLK